MGDVAKTTYTEEVARLVEKVGKIVWYEESCKRLNGIMWSVRSLSYKLEERRGLVNHI